MKRSRPPISGLRFLPLLLWVGWIAGGEAPEAPASGPATGHSDPSVAPLLEMALPSAPSLRFAESEREEVELSKTGGPATSLVPSPTPLHRSGALLDPRLRVVVSPYLSRLEQSSDRPRGPPSLG